MRTHAASFLCGAAAPAQLPRLPYPEVAFAGRSNVGKSSLLNRLVGQHGLARVSKTPGRTQQINFFLVDERLVFVDLPGYGFARVPAHVQAHWKQLVEAYITRRPNLRVVVVLIDLRRGIQPDDARLLRYLAAYGIATMVVATKADKLKRSTGARAAEVLTVALPSDTILIVSSAATGEGMDRIWKEIELRVRAPAARKAPH